MRLASRAAFLLIAVATLSACSEKAAPPAAARRVEWIGTLRMPWVNMTVPIVTAKPKSRRSISSIGLLVASMPARPK